MNVQMIWYESQDVSPRPIKAQKSRVLPLFLKTAGRQESAAERRSNDWTMSLNATTPKPRRCRRKDAADTIVCAATRHTTTAVHALERSDICPLTVILGRLCSHQDVTSVIRWISKEISHMC